MSMLVSCPNMFFCALDMYWTKILDRCKKSGGGVTSTIRSSNGDVCGLSPGGISVVDRPPTQISCIAQNP